MRSASSTARRTGASCTASTTSTCAAAATRSIGPATRTCSRCYRPLFTTSFLIDDFLADNGFFGAGEVLVSSASSKTAYGLGFCLAARRAAGGGVPSVGLTSPANLAFTAGLGCYDDVIAYADVTRLSPEVAAVYVDMSGDAALRATIHGHWRDRLAYSCSVGGTHWEGLGSGKGLPGPRPVLFFAPAQAKKRVADWGPQALPGSPRRGLDGLSRPRARSRAALAAGGGRTRPGSDRVDLFGLARRQGPRQRRPDPGRLMPAMADAAAQPRRVPSRYCGQISAEWRDDEPQPRSGHAARRRAARPGGLDALVRRGRHSRSLRKPPRRSRPCGPNEDNVDANSLGEMISGDPLMTLKVLAYESRHRGRRVITSAETVISALVMMGISPFFRAFGPQQTIDERLRERPEALAGLQRVLLRAHRGANFALAFAVHRTDPDAAVIHAAALLHEFAEMLLWCHAPELAAQGPGDAGRRPDAALERGAAGGAQCRARRPATGLGRSVAAAEP